ncbi:MAG: element excision factor XisH family protein [Bacteroidia bacterium]|nr:element excision factor XisH family protein [Bacteroidia bacterium]
MAKDIYHQIVREALEKDGWTITHDPLTIRSGGMKMEVDLAAEQVFAAMRGVDKIAVEVKSFLSKSKLADFYEAKGKYDVYLRALGQVAREYRLYLAVEEAIYNSFFQKPFIKDMVEDENIRIIVFSEKEQTIVSWIN